MKKTLLIAFLFIPFLGFAQTTKPIEGFLGIKFGSSKLAVITAMKAKGAKISENDKDGLYFTNVKLAGRNADALHVDFVNNKASRAFFYFTPDPQAQAIQVYNNLVDDFTSVYGNGEPTKKYTYPYEEGGDDTMLGLTSGHIDFHTIWNAPNDNKIVVTIATQDSELTILVMYQSQELKEEQNKLQNQQNKSDL